MTNEQKAQYLAEQIKPCAEHFYNGFYQGALVALNAASADFTPVQAIDVDGDWYVIPNELEEQFTKDTEDEELTESGEFSDKYGEYATGGALSLVQLYKNASLHSR